MKSSAELKRYTEQKHLLQRKVQNAERKKKDDEDSQATEMEARESAVTALLEMSE